MSGTVDDTRGESGRTASRAVPYLVLVLEHDHPTWASARYALDGVVRVDIGRGDVRSAKRSEKDGVVVLDVQVPSAAMSSRHARLVRAGETWALEDLGSTNGTRVNGERVTRAVLRDGDRITLGRTIFRVTPPLLTPTDAPLDLDVDGAELRAASVAHVTLDPAFRSQLDALARIARSTLPVLVLGETGTGKEVLARTVHARSQRKGAFIGVNCGAIPPTLVESQLFGHVKGAFSGAVRDEPGFFRAAEGGTLFLDEIGDLPLASQVALLRALQEREVLPVGATRPLPVDLRLVAATHQEIETAAARGSFRRDLLARISGFTIAAPPLRARPWDIGILIASLLHKLCRTMGGDAESVRMTREAGEALVAYAWPLNTRELEQCLARALTLAGGEAIDLRHLPPAVGAPKEAEEDVEDDLSPADVALRKELLEQLARCEGNLADVARAMGKARMQVHRWCKRFGVDPNAYRR